MFSKVEKFDPEQLFREQVWNFVCPFNGSDASAPEIFLKTQFLSLFLSPETKKINVAKRDPSLVFMD